LKRIGLLLAFAVFLVSCAQNTRVFTRRELQETMSDPAIVAGVYFWDEFGQYRDLYNLSEEESMLLGRWYTYGGGTYYFFPNRLFVFCGPLRRFKDDPARLLEGVLGTWSIKRNTVYVRIFGVDVSTGKEASFFDTAAKHEYLMIDPYDQKIIDIREIHPNGYAKKFFNNDIEVPKSLKEKLIHNRPSELPRKRSEGIPAGIGAVRYIYRSELNTSYGFLRLVPHMAEDNVSGMDIVTNPALFDEYFVQSLPFPFNDF
jgi:hypothetical protein